MKKYYLFLSLIALLISSCEKDDFCIEPITPNMIIRFYNATNISETKAVTDLTVNPNDLDSIYTNVSIDSIVIPLDVTSNQIIYNFSSGGVVGDVIATAMMPAFNFTGTSILLLCFFFAGLTLLTGVSWVDFVDYLGDLMVRYLWH